MGTDATTALGRAQEAGMAAAAKVNKFPLRKVVDRCRIPSHRGGWSGFDILACGHVLYLSGGGSGFGGSISQVKARRCFKCHDRMPADAHTAQWVTTSD